MHITRFDEAPSYEAPNHFDMRCLRLQGKNAGPSSHMWMGLSQILPGGSTSLDNSPFEKLYFVVQGVLTVTSELNGAKTEAVLGQYDSCRFAPDEKRQLVNKTNLPVMVLLVMPTETPPA
jgi:quercetin dioxygenase-like cupin family protein